MSEWTSEARNYLTGYLQQVAALAAERGDDGQEITEQLRDHVERELEQTEPGLVTLDQVRRVLQRLGTPEEILSGDRLEQLPLSAKSAPPPPPLPRPHPPQFVQAPPARQSNFARNCLFLTIALAVLVFLIMPVVGILSAILLPAASRAREAARRASCQNNLKQMGLLIHDYHRNTGSLPPYMAKEGVLMMDLESLDLTDHMVLQCPSRVANKAFPDGADDSYLYLPFPFRSEEDVAAFAVAYKALSAETDGPVSIEALVDRAPELRPAVSEGAASKAMSASETLIMMDRGGAHVPAGGNVLFLDGHVEFRKWGEFPMTAEMFQALEQAETQEPDALLVRP